MYFLLCPRWDTEMNKIWPLPSKNLQTTNKHIWNYNVSLQFQVSLTEITIMSFRRWGRFTCNWSDQERLFAGDGTSLGPKESGEGEGISVRIGMNKVRKVPSYAQGKVSGAPGRWSRWLCVQEWREHEAGKVCCKGPNVRLRSQNFTL